MPKSSKILIAVFLALSISVSFTVSHFSNAQDSENNVSAIETSDLNSESFTASTEENSVYICPEATSLEEINPLCPGIIVLKLGETIDGLTLSATTYEGQEYYLVFGFTNGGGGVNLPPVADANGPYEGDGGLPIILDASNSSDPNNDPLQYRWDFDDDGIWDTDWLNIPKVDRIWNNDYEEIIKLEVSDGQFTATDTTSVEVISPKTFKEETIDILESAKTGNGKIDRKIDQIIKHIENSLNDDLWIDRSHLVFFKKDNCFDLEIFNPDPDKIGLEEMFEFEPDEMELKTKGIFKGKCLGPKIGLRVFHEEYIAAKLMFEELRGRPRIPEEIKLVFQEVINKLIKADQLLAKVAVFDAENIPIQNPKFTKIVEHQISKAKEELIKAEQELAKNRPSKAIMRLGKAWLYAQFAIKFANLETKP